MEVEAGAGDDAAPPASAGGEVAEGEGGGREEGLAGGEERGEEDAGEEGGAVGEGGAAGGSPPFANDGGDGEVDQDALNDFLSDAGGDDDARDGAEEKAMFGQLRDQLAGITGAFPPPPTAPAPAAPPSNRLPPSPPACLSPFPLPIFPLLPPFPYLLHSARPSPLTHLPTLSPLPSPIPLSRPSIPLSLSLAPL